MTAIVTNNAEGGVNGTAVTVDNASATSGVQWDAVTLGTGTSITYASAPKRGNLAYKFSTGSTSATTKVSWSKIMPGSATMYARFYLYLPTYNSSSFRCLEFADTGNIYMSFGITSSGKISLRDTAQAQMVASTLAIPVARWVRIELKLVSHPTAGQVTLNLYLEADSPYPSEKQTSAATFATQSGGQPTSALNIGLVGTNTTNYTIYMDDIGLSDTGFLGPADQTYVSPLLLSNNAEMNTDGALVTGSNSGDSVNTFFNSFDNTSGTMKFSTARAAHGTRSYLFEPANNTILGVNWTSFSAVSAAMRGYLYITGYPSASTELAQFATNPINNFALIGRLAIGTTGTLRFLDSTSAITWTSTATIPLNSWIRFEMVNVVGTSTSNGIVKAAFYTLDSTTALDSYMSSTENLGTANISLARFGKYNANDYTAPFNMDEIAVLQGTTNFIGPYTGPPAVAPTYTGIIPPYGWGQPV